MNLAATLRKRLAVAVAICWIGAAPSVAGIRFGGSGGSVQTLDFEEFASMAVSLGSAHVTLESASTGMSFGEKLVGQVLSADGLFDVVTGTPTFPLALDTTIDGNAGVNVIHIFGSTAIDGIGALGFPDRDALAEGAVTVLYAQDQRLVGFDVLGNNGGTLRTQFFNRSGAKVGDVAFEVSIDGAVLFSSDQRDIAAITVTNNDFGGFVYDNFRFIPAAETGASACSAGGPYDVSPIGDFAEVTLNANVVDDPNGDLLDYSWGTNCPGASFDDDTVRDATLFADTSAGCSVSCAVTLITTDGLTTDTCSAPVTISGASGTTGVTCPSDVTVESDGFGNLDALDGWLASGVSDDPDLQNDFAGMTFACGSSGSVTVTWWIPTSGSSPCNGDAQCSATFTIKDTIPPELDVDTTPIVVAVSDCDEDSRVFLPQATASDGATITTDAPDAFLVGSTTVTYTATDECGLTTTATVDVTILFDDGDDSDSDDSDSDDNPPGDGGYPVIVPSGLDVYVAQRIEDAEDNRTDSSEALVGVAVLVFDRSKGSCARNARGKRESQRQFENIVTDCEPINFGTTDEDGLVRVDVPPGNYLVIVPVDWDGDSVPDQYAGRTVGKLHCGQWKEVDIAFDDRSEEHRGHDDHGGKDGD